MPKLETIRFRYREEEVVEEPAEPIEETTAEDAPKKSRRRNRRGKGGNAQPAPKADAVPVQKTEPAPKADAPAGDKPKKPNFHHRRHRRPKAKQGE